MSRQKRLIRHALTWLLVCLSLTGRVNAADFDVDIQFHINTEKYDFANTVTWLQRNITKAESLYSNTPALKIHATFVQENHPAIQSRKDDAGNRYSYLGFTNAQELEKFLDDNFDNQARTKTEGHLTILVVDDVVKNEAKDKGLCGRATFPHWVSPFTRKRGILLATCESDDFLLAHELGHFLSIKHTFEPYVNFDPFSVSNCNKEFGNHIKCNSCQGQALPGADGSLRNCNGTSNVMDYCSSATGSEVLNACQLKRASSQRASYQTNDGSTNYQAMAGVRGEGSCKVDSECNVDEFCTAGVLDLTHNVCKAKLALSALCTNKRQCTSDRCNLGKCAAADECQMDLDCGSGNYCGDPVMGQRQCREKLRDGALCTKADQCEAGRCKSGFCSAAASALMGQSCRFNDECREGTCNAAIGGATQGTCVCNSDDDCGSGKWCNKGLDLKVNSCKSKLNKGDKCGKTGSVGNNHKCSSGECSGFPKYVCK